MKKRVTGYIALSLLFCCLGFAYSYFVPKLETFILTKATALGSTHSPFEVQAETLTLKPWLLGVEVRDLKLTPKAPLQETLRSISVSKAFTRLSLFALLRGQVRIANVHLDTVRSQVFVKTDSNRRSSMSIPLDQIFSAPVDSVEIQNLTLLGRVDPQETVFKLENLQVRAENRFRSLWVDVNAPSVLMKPSGPTPAIEFQTEVRGLIETDQIRLTALKVKREDSYLVSSGFFWGDIGQAKINSSEMASKLHLKVSSLKDWFAAFAPKVKVPKLSGVVDLTATSGFKAKEPYVDFKVSGEQLNYEQFEIGRVQLNGTYSSSRIQKLSGYAQNSGGKVDLKKFSMSLKGELPFELEVNPNIELSAFLKSIGLRDIPVFIQLAGSAKCSGVIKSSFKMNCDQSEVTARELHVYSQEEKEIKTIVKLSEAKARGSFEVTERQVQFAADLEVGKKSKGSTKGSVDFQTGFIIFFKGEHVEFADLENLANLKIEGSGSVEGETRGNSRTAKLSLSAKMKEVWLDDFGLGQVSSQVRYERGYLHFKDASGLFGSTRYAGHLSINIPESQIYVYVKSPYLELPDVKSILERRLPLPFPISGTGQGEFKGSGPLNIEELNYEIKTSLFRGSVAGESFDSLNAELRAVDGELSAERVKLTKGPGEVTLSGTLKPAWTVDLTATGKNLRLEQSENISHLGMDLQGNYSFTTKVVGEIDNPIVEINGQTSNMITGSVAVEDSQVQLKITESHMGGSARLLGGQLTSEFTLPFSKDHPFSLKVKANQLNIASIFEAVSQIRQTYDFQTTLSLDADLSAPTGGFWKSTGLVSVKHFEMRRGGQSLTSKGPMRLVFNQGTVNSENFRLSGQSNYIQLNLQPSTKDKINGRLNGKIDLNLVAPFVSFASEMRGLLSLNTRFKGSIEDINVSGSAYLDNGYFKARDFPHPFTNLRADMLFNQKTLFFNSIQGEVADGKVTGDGRVQFENSKSIPVQISGQIKEASFNFPEGYRTKGSAQVALEGQYFPYRFKLNYDVTQAEIVSEFGGGESRESVRQSPYLPPSIAKSAEEPFYLDLKINFLNPLAISNSLVNASFKGNLAIQGTPQQMIMKGNLTPIAGGQVFFRDVPFEISTGFIEYDSVAPDNPKLYLVASARVVETAFDEDRRQTQRQYDVNMLVQGRAQSPQVTLTSQPPLPQKDIVSLLALGLTPEALDESRTAGQQMTSTSTTALGAALLQKPVGKRLKDKFGVDMKVTSSQQNSADVASAARVTLSKQWTPKLSVSASGTLEANPQSSVRLEYQVNRGLSVIGSWQAREQSAIEDNQSKDTNNSILGLDLEYRVQFK